MGGGGVAVFPGETFPAFPRQNRLENRKKTRLRSSGLLWGSSGFSQLFRGVRLKVLGCDSLNHCAEGQGGQGPASFPLVASEESQE